MDVRAGSATLAKISTSTLAAPARRSARGQPSTVAPDVSVVDQYEAAACDRGVALRRYAKRTLDIGGAFRPGQPDLLHRRLDALERGGRDRQAAFGRDRGGKHGR